MALLWKDFGELEDCEKCPLKEAEYCTGGHVCYGGEPIEPPCCSFDDDTDLEKWVDDAYAYEARREVEEDKRIQKQKEQEEKNKQAQKLRRETKRIVFKETQEINQLRKIISSNEALIRLSRTMSFASSVINGTSMYEERVKPKHKQDIDIQNEQYRQRIAEVEAIKKEKLNQLRADRKNRR